MIALSLRARLAIWFAASVLLILAPFLVGLLVLQRQSMRQALDHHLQEDLEVAAEMLVPRNGDVVWRTDAERDHGYDAGSQRWVEVYSDRGEGLYFRGRARQRAIRARLQPPVGEAAGFRTLRTPAGAWVRTLALRRSIGGRTLWIRVSRSEDPLRQDLRRLAWLVAVAAPLAVLAATLAGYFISGRALAPLARMADRARSISADHLSERLPVENPDDELGRLAGVFNETFARLEASFARLKQFTADASHELRTPLTAIRSVGEVGLREVREPGAYQEIIGSMLEEADRLSRMVDTLLTLSRWESGRVRPSPAPVDLALLTRDVAGQLSVLAEDRDVAVDVAIEGPMMVSADPVMTRQAVTNVLDNAIKFTPAGGRVRIAAGSTALEHEVIVDDEGPGIPPHERARVFERFYRIDHGRDRGSGGSGLGLAIVHWAVSANQGRVEIRANPAGGTRVIIRLPRFDDAREASPSTPSSSSD